jgi:hypothetical protein
MKKEKEEENEYPRKFNKSHFSSGFLGNNEGECEIIIQ